jgi:hypothetical protein
VVLAACNDSNGSSGTSGGDETNNPVQTPDTNPTAKPQLTLFSATPSNVEVNGTTTLRWSTSNANSCTASDGWSGDKPTSGSELSAPLSEDSSFRIVCTGPGGQASATVNVSVEEPPQGQAPTLTLSASPSSVAPNETTTIDWLAAHANSCTASGAWSGSRGTQGSFQTPTLNATSEFNLECSGDNGDVSRSVTVTVDQAAAAPEPTLTLSASTTSVNVNGTATLSWESANTTECTGTASPDGAWTGDKETSSSQLVGPIEQTRTYSLTCTGAGGDITRAVTINVNSGSADNGIPEFARWEQNMITFGQQAGPRLDPSIYAYTSRWQHAYYDAAYVYYRIMDYTGQTEPWLSYAGWGRQTWYEERYDRPNYNLSGYHRFSLGMLEDFLRGNPSASSANPAPINSAFTLTDFDLITQNGAFIRPVEFQGTYCGSCTNVSRELAYAIVAHVVSERAGLDRKTHSEFGVNESRLQTYIRWLGRQMEQWRNASYQARGYQPDYGTQQMQPFMTGLTMKALIDFYEWEVESGRNPNAFWEDPTDDNSWPTIVDALADFTNWLYADARVRNEGGTPSQYVGLRMWDENAEAFRYADRYSTSEGQSPDVVAPAADLNMLIAPAYAWVYKQTGSSTAREQGDAIFAGGVRGACLNCGGKQFNQSYIYSFDYVRWRTE